MRRGLFILAVACLLLIAARDLVRGSRPRTAEEALEMERAKLLGLAPIGSLHRDVVQALGEMGYTLVAKEESAGIVGIKRTFLVEYHPLLIRLTYDALLKCHFVDGVLTMVETELYIHGLI